MIYAIILGLLVFFVANFFIEAGLAAVLGLGVALIVVMANRRERL